MPEAPTTKATAEEPSGNSYLGNLARYVGERIPALSGEALGAAGNVAGFVGDVVGRDVRLPQQFGGRSLGELEQAGKAARKTLTGVDLGFDEKLTTSFDDVIKEPGSRILPFIFETGVMSAPDMAAMVLSFPGYVMSRTGEISYDRAKNDGRPEPRLRRKSSRRPASRRAPSGAWTLGR